MFSYLAVFIQLSSVRDEHLGAAMSRFLGPISDRGGIVG